MLKIRVLLKVALGAAMVSVVSRVLCGLAFAIAVLAFAPNSANARVVAQINISKQTMVVKVDGEVEHVWHVSTARRGFVTPRGSYAPKRLHQRYFSKKYYNSPMPYAIFFKGGYAVHGTSSVSKLGTPASHGCIRLDTRHAAALFALVKRHGSSQSRIVISG